nr:hypothetical protein Iba_chr03fCG1980 [Ipomoea batatas]
MATGKFLTQFTKAMTALIQDSIEKKERKAKEGGAKSSVSAQARVKDVSEGSAKGERVFKNTMDWVKVVEEFMKKDKVLDQKVKHCPFWWSENGLLGRYLKANIDSVGARICHWAVSLDLFVVLSTLRLALIFFDPFRLCGKLAKLILVVQIHVKLVHRYLDTFNQQDFLGLATFTCTTLSNVTGNTLVTNSALDFAAKPVSLKDESGVQLIGVGEVSPLLRPLSPPPSCCHMVHMRSMFEWWQ